MASAKAQAAKAKAARLPNSAKAKSGTTKVKPNAPLSKQSQRVKNNVKNAVTLGKRAAALAMKGQSSRTAASKSAASSSGS